MEEEDEVRLQWAAIERLPTLKLLRTSIFDSASNHEGAVGDNKKVVDVRKINSVEKHVFIEKLIKDVESDNLLLLQKLRERIDR